MNERRSTDPPGLDPADLREANILLSREGLAEAIVANRRRAIAYGVLTAVITSIIVCAVVGRIVASVVTDTVRDDVRRATVFNCNRTNTAARSVRGLRDFLTSDADYSVKLGALDDRQRTLDQRTAAVEHDLAVQIAKLGPVLPPDIAADYQALSSLNVTQANVSQQLSVLRGGAARLWAGTPHQAHGRRTLSLAAQIKLLSQAPCDEILLP